MDIFNLKWLVGDKISSVEYVAELKSWSVSFKSGSSLYIECIWRLLEDGEICSTSQDHGHQFGLEKPFDGVAALKEMGQYKIDAVSTKAGTGDLIIKFKKLFTLEILATSAGYEGWSATHPSLGTIFTQGGEIHSHKNA